MDKNLQIIYRLLQLAKNELSYSEYPKHHKEEYIFLANALNAAVREIEVDFDKTFATAVGKYKASLKDNGTYGWFHNPEKLVYKDMQRNQLLWAIYGGERQDIVFRSDLGDAAYLDLINQIDRTVLMTEEERKEHNEQCNQLALDILKEIEADEVRNQTAR